MKKEDGAGRKSSKWNCVTQGKVLPKSVFH